MRYERIFKEAIEKYKPRVEQITGVNLPTIDITSFDKETLQRVNTLRYNFLISIRYLTGSGTGVELAEAILSPILAGNNPQIWHNNLSVLNLLPKKSIEHIATHELGHIAHFIAAHKKGNDLRFRDEDVLEFAADYIALQATQTQTKPSFENRSCMALGYINGALERTKLTFQQALPDLGFVNLE